MSTPEILRSAEHMPSQELVLKEEKREFLEKKLAQYKSRLAPESKRAFWAPELEEWGNHYDAATKGWVAAHLLEHGSIDEKAFEDGMNDLFESIVQETHPGKSEDAAEDREWMLSNHEGQFMRKAHNAWEVIKAYNEGNEEAVVNSQPV